MMPFRFQLEGVLRLRRLVEDQARQHLDESMMRVRALEHSLAEAIDWSQKTSKMRASEQFLPAAEAQFVESVLRRTQEAIQHCKSQKQLEEQRASEQRAAYLEARRERETVSTLRDNALRQFQAEESRREQTDLDELFLGKLVHLRNAHPQAGTNATPQIDP